MEEGAQNKKYKIRKWRDDCWARIFSLFREYNLQRVQSIHEDSTEGEEMKRQERMKVMKDMTKQIRSKGRMDAENRWWVTELLAANCEKAWLHPEWEDTMGGENEKKKMRRKRWRRCINKRRLKCLRLRKEAPDSCPMSLSLQHGEEEHRS